MQGRAGTAPVSARAVALLLLLAALCAVFVALGSWQLQRRAWKRELIARVDQHLHAAAVAAPGRERWPTIGSADEYTQVYIDGEYLPQRDLLVQALTTLGAGFWVVTPLRSEQGEVVLINRGFVDAAHRDASTRAPIPQGRVQITGLLRLSEPGGAFLHHNDVASGRWYSRDVNAMAATLSLTTAVVAPYFIDAAGNPDAAPDTPMGGLTVVHFRNAHLIYALTWYGLGLMTLAASVLLLRMESHRAVRVAPKPP